MSTNLVAYPQKRRTSRIEKAIPLAVQGVDVSRSPFREEVTTVAISCHGCSYQMKHEVLPGSLVVLEIGQRASGSESPTRARVKWVERLATATDAPYGIAVEFENAANIWGISSPPEDWLPAWGSKAAEPRSPGRELQVVPRAEVPTAPARSAGVVPASLSRKNEGAASQSPWFSDLMAGISSQIQVTVTEIAAATLANERHRLLEEFRVQLQNEAAGTMEQVIETSKEELARRGLQILTEASDASVRSSHERLLGAIEQDVENARQRMLIQGNELNQRVDSMATRTIEQLQRTIETSRAEAAARFVTRLREQIAPVLDEAKADLQRLVASQSIFKEESQALYARVTSDLEHSVTAKLMQTHEELDQKSTVVLAECNERLLELSQTFENVARDSIQTLIASATDNARKNLEESAGEISSNFTDGLEGHVRDYLEFISDSIAEFPKKTTDS